MVPDTPRTLPRRMNIVFITVDAWRYDALGVAPDKRRLVHYGVADKLRTPNLDRFANEGIYFSNAFVTAPHTPPSHASIMTGLYPPQHGVRSFCYERLPRHIRTLAEVLRDEGYATITLRESEDLTEPGILEKVEVLRGFETVVHELKDLSRHAQEAAARKQPVFAFLHLWDLHGPYLYSHWAKNAGLLDRLWQRAGCLSKQHSVPLPPPDGITEKAWMDFQRRVAAQVTDVDRRIRMLLDLYIDGVTWFDEYRWPAVESTLQEAGLWDDTAIFVFADHGEGVHRTGKGFNVVWHGHSLLDDVLRVPLLVRGFPDVEPMGVDTQVSLVHLAPTALDFVGIEPTNALGFREHQLYHGTSLLPRLRSPCTAADDQKDLHFAELCRPPSGGGPRGRQHLYQRCVRGHGYKLFCHNGPVWMGRFLSHRDRIVGRLRSGLGRLGLSDQSGSITVDDGAACDRLHWVDLKKDPDELHPCPWDGEVPEAVAELRGALTALYTQSTRGPVIDQNAFDEAILERRLAALGYLED